MLKSLYLENIAVIQRASIDFEGGFTVLTGETGAGKSIVIDAINMALGERTSREVIRTGAASALVSALFALQADSPAAQLLQREGFADIEELLLERSITAEGRSTAKLNGRPVTAAQLRELGSLLLNIHGQHDNQHLLQPERHIDFLDAYAGLAQPLEEYRAQYREWRALCRELESLQRDERELERELDLLRHQCEEIEHAALVPGEEEELTARRRLIQNAQRVADQLNLAHQTLSPDDGEGAVSLLGMAMRALSGTASLSEELGQLSERAGDLYYQLEDLSGELREALENLSFDPEEAERVEGRLALIGRLKHKYGDSVEEILQSWDDAALRLETLEFSENRKEMLASQIDAVYNRVQFLAEGLTASRTAAAEQVEQQVEQELSFLNMEKTRFVVSVTPRSGGEPGEQGADEVAFLISTNPGEAPRPLAKIVSGGELSRVMLALKSILGRQDGVETLIFDEIDAGVSGSAADKIGRKLQELSQGSQVLCVTHLSQIASLADHHLLIEKKQEERQTTTGITELDREGRIAELARLISGASVTELTLEAAKEMLDKRSPAG